MAKNKMKLQEDKNNILGCSDIENFNLDFITASNSLDWICGWNIENINDDHFIGQIFII